MNSLKVKQKFWKFCNPSIFVNLFWKKKSKNYYEFRGNPPPVLAGCVWAPSSISLSWQWPPAGTSFCPPPPSSWSAPPRAASPSARPPWSEIWYACSSSPCSAAASSPASVPDEREKHHLLTTSSFEISRSHQEIRKCFQQQPSQD